MDRKNGRQARHARKLGPKASITPRWIFLVTLSLALLLTGPASAGLLPKFANLPHRGLLPSELSPGLASLDYEIPAPASVAYASGQPGYDEFFLRAAKVHGAFVITDSVTSKFGQALARATGGAVLGAHSEPEEWAELLSQLGEDGPVSPPALAELRLRESQLETLLEVLPGLTGDIGGLVSESQRLASTANQDFRGIKGKLKLALVLGAIQSAASPLPGDARRATSTIGYVSTVVGAFRQGLGSDTVAEDPATAVAKD